MKTLFTISLLSISFIFCSKCFSQTESIELRDQNKFEHLENLDSSQNSNAYNSILFTKKSKPSELYNEKSSNNNCVNAATLTTAGSPICFNVSTDNYQAGELSCPTCSSGAYTTPRSVWFIFEATSISTTMNINTNETYWLNTAYTLNNVAVYGPYSSAANATSNCMPTAAQNVLCISDLLQFDPLFSYSFATTTGSYYLIQVSSCDHSFDPYYYSACVWVNPTPSNNQPTSPATINSCGTTFNGTNIGYSPSNGFPGMENLDNNNSTTCPTCTAGDDVSYVVNNDSWFQFCATSASDYTINLNGITNCINNDGLQMTIFRGNPTNFTTIWNAASPSLPGSSQTSPVFSVAAGECIYLLVDGFAADQCDYSYTLSPVGNPCLVSLSADLLEAFAYNLNQENYISWTTMNEKNSSYFKVLKSIDGINWNFLSEMPSNNLGDEKSSYVVKDKNYRSTLNYYKIEQYDLDGSKNWEQIVLLDNSDQAKTLVKTINFIGQEVNPEYAKGIIIYIYNDGTIEKRFQN